jgi:hypothetical protein
MWRYNSTPATVAAQDVQSKVAYDNMLMEQYNSRAVCHPNALYREVNPNLSLSIKERKEICTRGLTEDTCQTGWGKGRCQWGIPPEPGPPPIVPTAQQIAVCKVEVEQKYAHYFGIVQSMSKDDIEHTYKNDRLHECLDTQRVRGGRSRKNIIQCFKNKIYSGKIECSEPRGVTLYN